MEVAANGPKSLGLAACIRFLRTGGAPGGRASATKRRQWRRVAAHGTGQDRRVRVFVVYGLRLRRGGRAVRPAAAVARNSGVRVAAPEVGADQGSLVGGTSAQ